MSVRVGGGGGRRLDPTPALALPGPSQGGTPALPCPEDGWMDVFGVCV